MKVSVAYLAVILIWSTTPLGIVWSSESVHPTLAVLLRMLIALVIGSLLLIALKIKLPRDKNALRLYGYSAIGVFGGMSFSYFSANYISSGLMSLIFGLAPILSGLLAQKLINETKFCSIKKFALTISVTGLMIVCYDKISADTNGILGIIFILLAVFFFSLSGVLVKSVDITINPIATTVGALLASTPMFFIVWLVFDANLPYQQWQTKSLMAIVYLGVFGSLVGFIAYFYVLQKLTASTVALVTMITPVMAMTLGAVLNNEPVSLQLLIGAVFVVSGLTCFQWSQKVSMTLAKKRVKRR
ncbi:membrane protein [Thalassotalea insulae]|uniref:Membrane protein n=1 Tax=Thalassotalea insulae TaxID=2056778 RepID=A0ABQ6GWH1_9GAMM|nr:DMT family transporter [Thalassotalea insulae]GLX80009.1 membrane protein [Thalassotalea insulae]